MKAHGQRTDTLLLEMGRAEARRVVRQIDLMVQAVPGGVLDRWTDVLALVQALNEMEHDFEEDRL